MTTVFLLCSLASALAHAANLAPVENFGANPAGIKMYKYVPAQMSAPAPLVVSLHGCKQDTETYAGAGWLQFADQWNFYLVFPEQNVLNNGYGCWNWFETDNIRRGHGEIASIMAMVEKMQADHAIDKRRIFVEGLSAGGYMAAILLASYPDVFAGGAIIAGGPAYCAMTEHYYWDYFGWWYLYSSGINAQNCMDGRDKSPAAWGDLVRTMGYPEYSGRWPVISVWHGTADNRVDMINQQELVDQWTAVHGIDQVADKQETSGPNNVVHSEYQNTAGKVLVETWLIPGMAHGAPIAVDAEHSCGEEGDFVLDAGICAVRHIGRFWGLDH